MAVFNLETEKYSQMVDIESTSLLSTCGILQIGACRYDIAKRTTFDHFTVNINIDDLYTYKCFEHDPETIKWWGQQSKETQKAVLTGGVPVVDALNLFEDWLDKRYSIGAFGILDIPALQYAFAKVLNKKEPWNYRKVIDSRTILLLSGGYDVLNRIGMDRQDLHCALPDAIAQCEVLFELLNPIE
jgi:hypothetical protein